MSNTKSTLGRPVSKLACKGFSLNLELSLMARVDKLASKSDQNRSSIVSILINEALEQRLKKGEQC